jgi:hypothetical protein
MCLVKRPMVTSRFSKILVGLPSRSTSDRTTRLRSFAPRVTSRKSRELPQTDKSLVHAETCTARDPQLESARLPPILPKSRAIPRACAATPPGAAPDMGGLAQDTANNAIDPVIQFERQDAPFGVPVLAALVKSDPRLPGQSR